MMTPDKFNKIVGKFPKDKVELEKVELGLIQDGISASRELDDYSDEINGLKKEFKSINTAIGKNEDLGNAQYKYIEKVVAQVNRLNKEMGITSKINELSVMEKSLLKFRKAIKL